MKKIIGLFLLFALLSTGLKAQEKKGKH